MNRQEDIKTVKRIEAEYSPATEKFELEDWLAQQLADTYHGVSDSESQLFRFRESVLLYAPETELINATILVGGHVSEHCILLSSFLYSNYGVKKLSTSDKSKRQLLLATHDFELMSMQITDDLIAWYETMSLAKSVLDRSSHD